MSLIPELNSEANVLICGASRGIGLALCATLLARDDMAQVWAVARKASTSTELATLAEQYGQRIKRVDCDARNEQSLEALVSETLDGCEHLHLVISTLGILHQDGAKAEKGLAQLTLASCKRVSRQTPLHRSCCSNTCSRYCANNLQLSWRSPRGLALLAITDWVAGTATEPAKQR